MSHLDFVAAFPGLSFSHQKDEFDASISLIASRITAISTAWRSTAASGIPDSNCPCLAHRNEICRLHRCDQISNGCSVGRDVHMASSYRGPSTGGFCPGDQILLRQNHKELGEAFSKSFHPSPPALIVSTGQVAWRTTCCCMLAIRLRSDPVSPAAAMTIKLIPSDCTAARIAETGSSFTIRTSEWIGGDF